MIITYCVLAVLVELCGGIMASPTQTAITVDNSWGTVNGQLVKKFVLKNKNNQEVDVITYGATITAVRTPDKEGKIADVALGFDNIEGYVANRNLYFGATIGRVANRVRDARFTLDNVEYHLSKNVDNFTLHGGVKGWTSQIWNATIENDSVVMTLLSEDGEDGYPGAVIASVTFRLLDDGQLVVDMKCFSTKATPINLTNHSYFNLAGHGTNAVELYKHKVLINADRWTITDSQNIPTGELRSVKDTIMDLRNLTLLGDVINQVPGGGYDNNFCLPEGWNSKEKTFVAKAVHPSSGRYLEVFSNQPGVQFYTAVKLPEVPGTGLVGKNGAEYRKHGSLCFETQNYPDAVNHENFPNSVLRPGCVYNHEFIYKFGVEH